MTLLMIIIQICAISVCFFTMSTVLKKEINIGKNNFFGFIMSVSLMNIGSLFYQMARGDEARLYAMRLVALGTCFALLLLSKFFYDFCRDRMPRSIENTLLVLSVAALLILWGTKNSPQSFLDGWQIAIFMIACVILPVLISLHVYMKHKDKLSARNLQILKWLLVILLATSAVHLLFIMGVFGSLNLYPPLMAVVSALFVNLAWENQKSELGGSTTKTIIDELSDAVMIIDTSGVVIEVNDAANDFFGHILGKKIDDYESIVSFYQENSKKEKIAFERGKRKYEAYVCNLLDTRETVHGYILFVSDVTDTKQYIEEILKLKDKAEYENKEKSTFLSNMSHEIRTPMNAIIGLTDVLLRESQDDKQREYLGSIKSSANGLIAIINDILDFSMIDSGRMKMVETDYEPMSLLNDLSIICLNRIGKKPIELFFDIDAELPAKLRGDAVRIRQIIINLLDNAIKFTEEGSVTLSIKCFPSGRGNIELLVSIRDTGIGIKESEQELIFTEFSQEDLLKKRNQEGTGLGLAITTRLIEQMGGKLELESVYGQGSTFRFSIRQKICIPDSAARLSGAPVCIAGCFEDPRQQTNLEKLASNFHVLCLPYEEINETEKPTCLFVDAKCFQIRHQELRSKAKKICVLHNPLMECIVDTDVILANKPLYSLNFVNILNQDIKKGSTDGEKFAQFTAPDARILVVDDNDMNLKVALALLSPLKMTVDVAKNGQEAVRFVNANRYDLVFMDHMMPVMDGIEATIMIRNMEGDYYQNLPILALTANGVVGMKDTFLKAGMNDWLLKPYEMKQIFEKLRKWLPSNLIVESTEQISTEEQSVAFPVIEGIDLQTALTYAGDETMLRSLMNDFASLIDFKKKQVMEYLEEDKLREYTIEVHALKSSARLIGAMELSGEFLKLEEYGNAEDRESIRRETPRVLELYTSFKEKLAVVKEEETEQFEVDQDEVVFILEKLRSAIEEFDVDKADRCMERLKQYVLSSECKQKIEELDVFVLNLDVENALACIDDLITKVEKQGEKTDA